MSSGNELDLLAVFSVDGGLTWLPELDVNDGFFDPDGTIDCNSCCDGSCPITTRIGEYNGVAFGNNNTFFVWPENTCSAGSDLTMLDTFFDQTAPPDANDALIYLSASDTFTIEWQEGFGNDSWNLYRGDLAVLRATGVYTQVPGSNPLAEQHCGLRQPFVQDVDEPEAGQVAFYLVTGIAWGIEGDLGTDSDGTTRPNTHPCP